MDTDNSKIEPAVKSRCHQTPESPSDRIHGFRMDVLIRVDLWNPRL